MAYCCIASVPPTSRRAVTTPATKPAMTHGFRLVGMASNMSFGMLGLGGRAQDVDNGRRAGDGQAFFQRPDLQLRVDPRVLHHLDGNSLTLQRDEAGEPKRQLKRSGRQSREL